MPAMVCWARACAFHRRVHMGVRTGVCMGVCTGLGAFARGGAHRCGLNLERAPARGDKGAEQPGGGSGRAAHARHDPHTRRQVLTPLGEAVRAAAIEADPA